MPFKWIRLDLIILPLDYDEAHHFFIYLISKISKFYLLSILEAPQIMSHFIFFYLEN